MLTCRRGKRWPKFVSRGHRDPLQLSVSLRSPTFSNPQNYLQHELGCFCFSRDWGCTSWQQRTILCIRSTDSLWTTSLLLLCCLEGSVFPPHALSPSGWLGIQNPFLKVLLWGQELQEFEGSGTQGRGKSKKSPGIRSLLCVHTCGGQQSGGVFSSIHLHRDFWDCFSDLELTYWLDQCQKAPWSYCLSYRPTLPCQGFYVSIGDHAWVFLLTQQVLYWLSSPFRKYHKHCLKEPLPVQSAFSFIDLTVCSCFTWSLMKIWDR